MSTVYAGPFSKNCNLRAVKRLFKSFGPVRSMSLVLETHQVMKQENLDFHLWISVGNSGVYWGHSGNKYY